MTADLIRTMVIDDEEPARSEIRYLLEQHPDVCIVYEAGNFQEALAAVRQCRPHLVFLDIEMPGMNGISLAEKMQEILQPLIVFATAHEEFAHKAFEINAADYLLKPFSPRRVAQCIDKVRSLLAARAVVAVNVKADGSPVCRQKLAIEQNGKAQIISTADIIAAGSSEGQVTIYTTGKTYHANMTLQDLQARLDESAFFRSHRGYLVNIEKIREVIPWFNGTYNLVLDGLANMEIPVSRQQAPKLKKIFGL
jgi:two-component system LytT family response regulator/two-component system response regulator LytT